MSTYSRDDYVRHAIRHGSVALVFEEAARDLDADDLRRLGVRLQRIDPKWKPPGPLGVDAGSCAVCGRVIAGRSDRRTCSDRCRVALHRSEKSRTLENGP